MKPPKGKQKERELPKAGPHNAVCISLIDFGTQPGSAQFPDEKRIINIGYQLIGQKTSDGKAMCVYRQFTFSSHPKSKLMGYVMPWLGLTEKDLANFDMDDLLGKPALVTVKIAKTATGQYANIDNISGLPGKTKLKATEPLVSLYLDPAEFDKDVFDDLPEWMRNKIATSPEYAEATAPKGRKKK
jgi:hypothetical protein